MIINIAKHKLVQAKLAKLMLIAFSALLVSACGESSNNQTSNIDYSKSYPAENGGTLIEAMTADPSGLIAMTAGESAASAIAGSIFNSLLKYDKNLDLAGELAESWDVSNDQKPSLFT